MTKILNFTLLLYSTSAFGQTSIETYPNVIFVLADDLGYGDLSCLNEEGKISTPNLDKMANEGAVFIDAHSSSSVSTPTRYGVLTGRYNWRSTLKEGVLHPYDKPIIKKGRTTLADMMKTKGYKTACIGKWHLGLNYKTVDKKHPIDERDFCNIDFTAPIKGGPCDLGFDYFFGINAPNYPPYCFIENEHTIGIPDKYKSGMEGLDCRAGRGIDKWSFERILPEIINKSCDFIEKSVREKTPFFLYLPLPSPHTPITPTKQFIGKSNLNLYADYVMQTDAALGTIVDKIEEMGVGSNTLIVFTSDNGCSPVADFKFLKQKGHNPSYRFKGMKSDLYEGGHHIPCIVKWPKKILPCKITNTICLTDFFATLAAIVDYHILDNEGEDSYNLLPLFHGDSKDKFMREAVVHHSFDGSFAIRKGEWKLLLTNTSGGWSAPHFKMKDKLENISSMQLFNLSKDPEECNNVISLYPQVAEDLKQLMIDYINNGRSTPGLKQKNDYVREWKQLQDIFSCD